MNRAFFFAVLCALLCVFFVACEGCGVEIIGERSEEVSSEISSENKTDIASEVAFEQLPKSDAGINKVPDSTIESIPEDSSEPVIEQKPENVITENASEAEPQELSCKKIMNGGGVCDSTFHYKINNECVPKEFVDAKDWNDPAKPAVNVMNWSYVEFAYIEGCGFTRSISAIWFRCQETLACSDNLKCSDIKWFSFECHNIQGKNECDVSKLPAVHGVAVGNIYDQQRKQTYYYVLAPYPYDGAYPRFEDKSKPNGNNPNDDGGAGWFWPWKEPGCGFTLQNILLYNRDPMQTMNPWQSRATKYRCRAGKCEIIQ